MYILNIASTIKKLHSKNSKDFIFEDFYQQMEFAKENLLFIETSEKKRSTIVCNKISRKNT